MSVPQGVYLANTAAWDQLQANDGSSVNLGGPIRTNDPRLKLIQQLPGGGEYFLITGPGHDLQISLSLEKLSQLTARNWLQYGWTAHGTGEIPIQVIGTLDYVGQLQDINDVDFEHQQEYSVEWEMLPADGATAKEQPDFTFDKNLRPLWTQEDGQVDDSLVPECPQKGYGYGPIILMRRNSDGNLFGVQVIFVATLRVEAMTPFMFLEGDFVYSALLATVRTERHFSLSQSPPFDFVDGLFSIEEGVNIYSAHGLMSTRFGEGAPFAGTVGVEDTEPGPIDEQWGTINMARTEDTGELIGQNADVVISCIRHYFNL